MDSNQCAKLTMDKQQLLYRQYIYIWVIFVLSEKITTKVHKSQVKE
jgi:hypothetical protein